MVSGLITLFVVAAALIGAAIAVYKLGQSTERRKNVEQENNTLRDGAGQSDSALADELRARGEAKSRNKRRR